MAMENLIQSPFDPDAAFSKNGPDNLIWRTKNRLFEIPVPGVMGILNITPDSYVVSSRTETETAIVEKAEKMLQEGAAILDIGAASSRPGSAAPDETVEAERIRMAVGAVRRAFPDAILSVDTWRSSVADIGLSEGAHIINDISAGHLDPKMPQTVARWKVPYIWMHMRGTPETMHQHTVYENILMDMLVYFEERKAYFDSLGIIDQMIDPGFGFAKTLQQNFEVLKDLSIFHSLRVPVLAGISRKSMITRLLQIKNEDALPATSALHMTALQQGVHLLRVHDVKEARQVILLHHQLQNAGIHPATIQKAN
jgi:dihydropteroate synthase